MNPSPQSKAPFQFRRGDSIFSCYSCARNAIVMGRACGGGVASPTLFHFGRRINNSSVGEVYRQIRAAPQHEGSSAVRPDCSENPDVSSPWQVPGTQLAAIPLSAHGELGGAIWKDFNNGVGSRKASSATSCYGPSECPSRCCL